MADLAIAITGNASGLVGAVGQAEASLGRLEGSATKAGSVLTTALGTAAVAGVVALGAGLVGALGGAMAFEKQISAIGAVSGLAGDQLKPLSALALQLGKDTSFSASEAGKGIEELAKAGVSIENIMSGAAKASLDLAAAGAVTSTESATIIANAMNVFGLAGDEATRVADLIASASSVSAIDVNQFGFAMASAGTVAATLGLPLEDLTAAFAQFSDAGLKGSDMGTSFKSTLLGLQPTTKAQVALFKELGLMTASGANQFFTAEGKAKSYAEMSQVLKTALGGLTKEQQIQKMETLFGTDGMRTAIIMMEGGGDAAVDYADKLKKLTAAQVADTRLDNLAGSVEKLKGSLETGAIILGGMFTPALKGLADAATEGVNSAIAMLEKLPMAWDTISQIFQGNDMRIEFNELLSNLGLGPEFVAGVYDVVRQVGDAWRTVQQVFGEGWEASDSIDPFVNMVGIAALVVRDQLIPALQQIGAFITGPLAEAFGAAFTFLAEHKEIIVGVAAAWGSFVVISTVAGWIGAAIGVWGAMSAAIAASGGVLAAIVAVLGGPVTVGILAVSAAIGLLAAAWTVNLGGIQEKTAAFLGIVGPYFNELVAIVQTALGGDLAGAFIDFQTLIRDVGAQLGPLLATWGAEFVTWITDAAPPMLEAAAQMGVGLLTWLGEQVPAIAVVLLGWGAEFVTWVTNATPPLLAALGTLAVGLIGWIAAQIPPLVTALLAWGLEFAAWVVPATTPLLAALATLGVGVVTWITTTALPTIVTALLAWGTAFSAWIGPAATEALVQFGVMLGQFTVWIAGTGLPAIEAGLVAWRTAMSAWITASGPEVLTAMGGLILIILSEMQKLPAQVMAVGITTGKAIVTGMIQGAEGDAAALGAALQRIFTSAIMTAWNGAKAAVPGLGAISSLIGGPDLFTPGSPGGRPSAAPGRSFNSGVAPGDQIPRLSLAGSTPQVNQFDLGLSYAEAQAACGPATLAWFMNQTGRTPTGAEARNLAAQAGWDAGRGMYGPGAMSRALTNVGIPNTVNTSVTDAEIDRLARSGAPFSLSTGEHYYQVQGGSNAGLNVGGSGTALRGGAPTMSLEQIRARGYDVNGVIVPDAPVAPPAPARREPIPGLAPGDQLMPRIGLGGDGSGLDIGRLPLLLDDVIASVPPWLTAMEQIEAGATTSFGGVAQAGIAAGAALVSASTDDLGNVTRIYSDSTGVIGATITDAAGLIVNTWGTMGTGVSDATAAMGTDVTTQTAAMATTALTSVTDLGTGIMTITTDMAGTTVATITDMAGNVTSQYTQLGAGVTEQATAMATSVTDSVTQTGTRMIEETTNAAGVTVARYQEMNGEIVTIVTDQNGKVVADFTLTGEKIGAVTDNTGTKLVSATTNSMGGVTEIYREKSGEIVTIVTDASGKVVEQFTSIGTAAEATVEPLGLLAEALVIETPDYGGIVDQFEELADAAKDAEKAAKKAADAIGSMGEDFGGDSAGERGWKGERALGGPVSRNGSYLVGERGPELFTPSGSGYITPNDRLGGDIDYDRLARAIASASGGGQYNLTINSNAETEPLVADFAILSAMARGRG